MEAARLWARGDLEMDGGEEEEVGDGELYGDAHAEESLNFFGLTVDRGPVVEAPALPEFHLWPENVSAFRFFVGLNTQWRTGMNGRTGMDYGAVRGEIERREGKSCRRPVARRRERLFSLMVAMEAGALKGWRQKADEEQAERELQQAMEASRRGR